MTPDSPTEFDFDFQVDHGQPRPSRRVADDAPSNGAAGDGPRGAATPRAPEDLDAPALTGNGEAPPSSSPRRRRFVPSDPGDGDGNGRTDDDWFAFSDDSAAYGSPFPSAERESDRVSRPPLEGRELARASRLRAARRRAEGRSRIDEAGDVPFETLLAHQPQKSRAARRATPLLDAVRDAASIGAERLRNGANRVRDGASNARQAAARARELSGAPSTPGAAGNGKARGPIVIGRRTQAAGGNGRPATLPKLAARRPRRPKPGRIKKLRLAIVVLGLGILAIVSTFFGMMMSVAREIPNLEADKFFAVAKRSEVLDNHGRKVGTLLNNNQQILVDSEDISPYMKQATVAIEDERFYEHTGVDIQAMARAGVSDVIPGGSTQGGSTVTQQFIKNALEAQNSRTVFQKFREAAYAYHLERQWDKDKILTSYLNTVYFGAGAYGIEAAAKTYFGHRHPGCGVENGEACAAELTPPEAALLAGLISNPYTFSPKTGDNQVAMDRRNLVLQKMREQGMFGDIADEDFEDYTNEALPAPSEIQKPVEDSEAPWFTSWLRQVVVDRYGADKAFGGGLQIHTTLDLEMQQAIEDTLYSHIAGIGPSSAVVVLDNDTAEIRAMVGGLDYEGSQFNSATQGHRQPGSSIKPFILATALQNGYTGSEVLSSQPKVFDVPGSGGEEEFEVHNYEDQYLGSASIATATTYSDNSVYAELGLELGTRKVANLAEDMGLQTDVSTNPAMVLGGVEQGFTPLEMAHAFETIAMDGKRISGNLDTIPTHRPGPRDDGPVPIKQVEDSTGDVIDENQTIETEVLDPGAAQTAKDILGSVITTGTGVNAQFGDDSAWGKTGTTENYGDAWFCGANDDFTTCVWVGYQDGLTPMETEYGGAPVAGGTFPAEIWAAVMAAVMEIKETSYEQKDDEEEEAIDYSEGYSGASGSGSEGYSGGGDSSSSSSSSSSSGGGSSSSAPAPAPAPAPSGGGGSGGSAPSSGGGVGL